jgi:hypothetical protein
MALERAYRQFHGHASRQATRYNFHVPKGLIVLGRAVKIEYESDKLNGGGDGKKAVYHHTFKKGRSNESPLLAMDERKRGQLYIIGNRIVVTDRGIEN